MQASFWKYRRATHQSIPRNGPVDSSLRAPFGEDVNEQIKRHALEEYPNECCGFVIDGVYHRRRNVHSDPRNFFDAEGDDLQTFATKGYQAVVHSHTKEMFWPSKLDMEQQELMDVPWAIATVVPDTDGNPFVLDLFWFGDSLERLPWENRIFRPSVQDCFSLARDCHLDQGFDVPVMPRDANWWQKEPGKERQDLFRDLLEPSGYVKIGVDELKPWDGFACQYGTEVISHCGVLLPGEKVLHHLSGSYSEIVNAHRWVKRAKEGGMFFRWKGF